MSEFNAMHAWDSGYYHAVRGVAHMPNGTWLSKFKVDFLDGYSQAIRDDKWGTFDGKN